MKKILAFAVVALVSTAIAGGAAFGLSASTAADPKSVSHQRLSRPNYTPGQVLVRFKAGLSASERLRLDSATGRVVKQLGRGRQASDLYQLKPGLSTEEALRRLRADKSVLSADPNYLRKSGFAPNDPDMAKQWGLHNSGQTIQGMAGILDADIDAPEAWDIEMGGSTTVTVAVIDSGADHTHPDLAGKFWSGGDTPGNGVDDDLNGYVDDERGYNFAGVSQYSANIGNYFGRDNTFPLAQSIRGTGQPLTHVGLLIAKYGAPTANIVVSVRDSLDGIDLATTTITPSDVTADYAEVYKQLTEPVALTDGVTYYLVFRPTSANASNYYGIADNYSGEWGYVDDPYKEGNEYWWNGAGWTPYTSDDWYFRTNPNANPRDDNGHGTHVAGIIGAATDNLIGVAGAAPGSRIMVLKAGDSSGSLSSADIIAAIHYAADNGADVVNMSFGGTSFSAAEQAAITYAVGKGVTLLAAAGNDGSSVTEYPAGYTDVIGVGATDNQDERAYFSNYNATVDVSAPGVDIYSTLPTYPAGINSFGYAQNYDFLSGTSMATPMAAGVAALVVAQNPGFTPQEVEQTLETTGKDLGTSGRDNEFGHSRVNAVAALGGISGDTTATPLEDYLFIRTWGGYGLADGMLRNPEDIAVDSSGNVYVTDTWTDRVKKFSPIGAFITKWGTSGTGDGQFSSPGGITVDSSGNVYVADTYNNRVQKFSSSGAFIAKWGTGGSGDGQFDSPEDLAVDSSGNVYVADTYNNRVQKFDSAGGFIGKWGSLGIGDGQFDSPGGLTVDSTGTVYVSDTWNDRVQKFDSAGGFVGKWGTTGTGRGRLSGPQGLAVDGNGDVFVADSWNNRIQKFSSNGEVVAKWGSYGNGNGEFDEPEGVAVDAYGNVYVADTWNSRVQKFGLTINEPGVPPVTSASTLPAAADGNNGWFVTAPLVTLAPDRASTTNYRWDAVGYAVSTDTPSWYEGGTRLNIRGDDVGAWYDLPFTFSFAGTGQSRVFLSSNGLVSFNSADTAPLNTSAGLVGKKALAPMWDDLVTDADAAGDIYVTQPSTDTVVFRWQAATYREHKPTNFAVALRADGSVKYLYRDQDGDLTPTIGISLGDGLRYRVLRDANLAGSPVLASYVFDPVPVTWDTYGGPLVAPEGIHSLAYFSTADEASETLRVRQLKVDSREPGPPSRISSTSHAVGSSSADRTVDMTYRAAEDADSGIDGYVTSWTKDATESPAGTLVKASEQTTETSSSQKLSDGSWYFNVRARDIAGNWSPAAHAGPFIIDGAPTSTVSVTPASPDGMNGWYVTDPTISLTADENADIYYSWGPVGPVNLYTGPFTVPGDGQHILQYYSVDAAGHAELAKSRLFKVDTTKPSGGISINTGAIATSNYSVAVDNTMSDATSGLQYMEFSDNPDDWSGFWSGWVTYSSAVSQETPSGGPVRTLYARFKDMAGNVSDVVSDSIIWDDVSPNPTVFSVPKYSTELSKERVIELRWSGSDNAGGSGLARYGLDITDISLNYHYILYYGPSTTGTSFRAREGHAYRLKLTTFDNAGNVHETTERTAIVPYNESRLSARSGFDRVYKSASSGFYLGSVRYSTSAGEWVQFVGTGNSLSLIGTGGTRRSRAKVYIDGHYVKTIDPYRTAGYRKALFTQSWSRPGRHTIRVVNLATPGRARFDVDGFAVGQP